MQSKFLLPIAIASLSFPVYDLRAEVLLDRNLGVASAIDPLVRTIKTYAAPRAKGMFSDSIWVLDGRDDEDNSIFSWKISGGTYISAIGLFTPNIDPLIDCHNNCDWALSRHALCHLFLFEANTMDMASVTALNIVRDPNLLKGKPRCSSVKAMAPAGNFLLITLGFSDSAEPAEARHDPPEFVTTVALHFDPAPGVLRVEQQDGCLGNPNGYKTIAAARKRLRECETAARSSQR